MGKFIVWCILIGIFLLAGEGLNIIRIAIFDKLADPSAVVWWRILGGAILMFGGITFLGGFVFYRDKKRGKVRPGTWRQ